MKALSSGRFLANLKLDRHIPSWCLSAFITRKYGIFVILPKTTVVSSLCTRQFYYEYSGNGTETPDMPRDR